MNVVNSIFRPATAPAVSDFASLHFPEALQQAITVRTGSKYIYIIIMTTMTNNDRITLDLTTPQGKQRWEFVCPSFVKELEDLSIPAVMRLF